MKNTLAGLSALAVCAGFLVPARGADDVTQPAFFRLFHRDPPPPPPPQVTRYLAVPAAEPCCPQPQPAPCCPQPQPAPCCPQTTCTQQYTLQSYYKQVTTYQTQTNYEPVTTYQTSSYYEPVVTMRTSCYYCPKTCSWKQTQVPETSYVLKTKTCPVQSYVAKCVQVPVTSCQKVYYYQPQTVCTQSAAPCCPTAAVPPSAPAPCCQPGAPAQPPMVGGGPPPTPPQVTATPDNNWRPPIVDKDNDAYRKELPKGPNGGSSWQPTGTPPPPPMAPSPPAPQAHVVKLDRIVLGADAVVEGEVTRSDKSPRAEAKVLFVNANQANQRETITTNHAGRFQVTLASGGWLVYMYNVDGEAVFNSRIEVSDESSGRIVLVSR